MEWTVDNLDVGDEVTITGTGRYKGQSGKVSKFYFKDESGKVTEVWVGRRKYSVAAERIIKKRMPLMSDIISI